MWVPCHHTARGTLIKQRRTTDKGLSSSFGLQCGANKLSPQINKIVTIIHTEPRAWKDSLDKRPTRWNMNMRFGIWNVRSLYRAGSLVTVSKCKLDSVGMQEVRWEGGGTERSGDYTFFYGKGNESLS
jgi:hypothetical protein